MSDLLRFSKLFNDELTLDNLERYVCTACSACAVQQLQHTVCSVA